MLKQLGMVATLKPLGLYNEVWEVEKLLIGWKEDGIIPIRKTREGSMKR